MRWLVLCALSQTGCLLLYEVDGAAGRGGEHLGGGAQGPGGAGGGAGGQAQALQVFPLGEVGRGVSVEAGEGALLSGPEATGVWLFAAGTAPARIATTTPLAPQGVLARGSSEVLVARRDVASAVPGLLGCDVGGCVDWAPGSVNGAAISGLAAVETDVALVRKLDGVAEVVDANGAPLASFGAVWGGGGAASARELQTGEWMLAWAASGSSDDGVLSRATRATGKSGFGAVETLATNSEILSLAASHTGDVYYSAAGGDRATYRVWHLGEPSSMDLGLSGPSPGLVAISNESLFVVADAAGGKKTVARCPLGELSSTSCEPLDTDCSVIGGMSADRAREVLYLTCDDALIAW